LPYPLRSALDITASSWRNASNMPPLRFHTVSAFGSLSPASHRVQPRACSMTRQTRPHERGAPSTVAATPKSTTPTVTAYHSSTSTCDTTCLLAALARSTHQTNLFRGPGGYHPKGGEAKGPGRPGSTWIVEVRAAVAVVEATYGCKGCTPGRLVPKPRRGDCWSPRPLCLAPNMATSQWPNRPPHRLPFCWRDRRPSFLARHDPTSRYDG